LARAAATRTPLHPWNTLDGIDLKTPRTKINIRYSAGWTDYIPGESLDDLLKRADDMLYANKNNREKLFVSSIVAE
jgi:PleD family two-component response regulator